MSIVPTVTEVNLILNHESAVAASFHVSLVESALVAIDALAACVDTTVVCALGGACVEIIPGVDVLATAWSASRRFTIALARKCRDRAACIDDETLLLLMATHIHIDVEIL